MTTDRPLWRRLRRTGRIAGGFAIVAFGWLVVVVGLTFNAAPGRSIAIIGPPSQALAAIVVAEGLVLSSNQYVTFARSDDAGFVARLYAAGAMLVLDADQVGGCSGRPPKPSAQS